MFLEPLAKVVERFLFGADEKPQPLTVRQHKFIQEMLLHRPAPKTEGRLAVMRMSEEEAARALIELARRRAAVRAQQTSGLLLKRAVLPGRATTVPGATSNLDGLPPVTA